MSDEQAWNDVAALWSAVFGEAPPVCSEPGMLLDVLVSNLAVTLPYQPGTDRGSMEIARAGQDAHVAGMAAALDRSVDAASLLGRDAIEGESIANLLVKLSGGCDVGIS